MIKTTQQAKNPKDRNPTGKGGFGDNPQNINPGGKPKNSLKSYVAKKLAEMSDEEKEKFLKKIVPELQWRMGEGNPATQIGGDKDNPLIVVIPKEVASSFGIDATINGKTSGSDTEQSKI